MPCSALIQAKTLIVASPRWKLAVALLSGVLMGLTPAPTNAWWLAWVALTPLWVLCMTTASTRLALLYALAWGVGYHGLALSWIRGLHPLTWLGVPWLASVAIVGFCWAFITLWGAAIVCAWMGIVRWFCRIRVAAGLRVLIGTATWCCLETLWSQGVLWWTSLSYTQSPHNLAILHLGQVSGPMLVTGAIVAINGLWAEAWMQPAASRRRLLIAGLLLVVGLHGLGYGLYSQSIATPADAALKVGLIQGNVPTRIKHFQEGVQLALDRYVRGYEALADQAVDLVVTPEGTFPWLWIGDPTSNRFYQTLRQRGVPAIVGTVGLEGNNITQTLFAFNSTGDIVGRYNKIKLVPLGEYIPLQSLLGGLIHRLSPVELSMLPGKLNQRFETPAGQAIAGICYESAFSQLFRQQAAAGGQWMLTASNNDPYNSAMMAQHHAQDVMRAIETDRWAVRVTNTGFSGIVDPHGRTLWLSGFRTYETHVHTVYRRQTQTLYVRWGNWLTPLLAGIALLGWGVKVSSERRN